MASRSTAKGVLTVLQSPSGSSVTFLFMSTPSMASAQKRELHAESSSTSLWVIAPTTLG